MCELLVAPGSAPDKILCVPEKFPLCMQRPACVNSLEFMYI